MNSFLFGLYRVIVPKPLRTRILKKNLRRKILDHFSSLSESEVNDGQREVLKYLENNPVSIFPYYFSADYSPEKVRVFFDPENKMHYVIHEGKKLYFRKGWGRRRIQKYYSDLSREQDPLSPHKYISDCFSPGNDDIVADIGAAEGNFSLSVIDKVKKIYLIEYNPKWIEALEATFAPWKHKVEILGKYVSDRDDEREIKLDSLISNENKISFLKIDVDGFEQKVLDGLLEFLSGDNHMKIALCTYHRHNDERDFTDLLERNGFSVTPSDGYMIHYYDKKIRSPWLRKGVIRAER